MSDEARRKKEREALAGGDPVVRAAASAAAVRHQASLADYARALIGEVVYLEGVRMNYLGVLMDVPSVMGEPQALIFSELWRVGEWGGETDLPVPRFCFRMPASPEKPRIVPWEGVGGEFGLAPDGWIEHLRREA